MPATASQQLDAFRGNPPIVDEGRTRWKGSSTTPSRPPDNFLPVSKVSKAYSPQLLDSFPPPSLLQSFAEDPDRIPHLEYGSITYFARHKERGWPEFVAL